MGSARERRGVKPRVTFKQGEELTASKLNRLSAQSAANRVRGSDVGESGLGGTTVLKRHDQNYIEQYRPFDVERLTATKIIVRGGAVEYYASGARSIVNLTTDSGTSRNPEDIKTIDDALSASTAYSVYLALDTGAGALSANLVETSSFPADAAGKRYFMLTDFTTTNDGYLPEIDPRRTDIVLSVSDENDHSWHYDPVSNTITAGSVWLGDNTTTAETLNSWDATPDDTTSITYYIKVDWTTSTNTNIAPTCTWVDSKSQVDGVWFIPVLEFDADGNCTERLCSDLYLPDVHIPSPSSASYDGYLKFNHTDQDVEWVYGTSSDGYKGPFFDGNGEVLDTDYVRAH